jgi:taurine dioxygenase
MLKIVSTGAALGADVTGVDLRKDIDEISFVHIRKAFDKFGVLRFRDQDLSMGELLVFAKRFGPLDPTEPGAYGGRHDLETYPELMVVSNVEENGELIGALGDGELVWHCDMSNRPTPPWGTFLYAVEVPKTGGATGFASMYAAFEELSDDFRAHLEGRWAVSDGTYDSAGNPNTLPISSRHPMIARHPYSNRNMLYLGRRRNGYIEGIPTDESDKWLDELWDYVIEDKFVWIQEWRAGDLVLWDNLATIHRRDSFDPQSRRIMWRLQLTGQSIAPALDTDRSPPDYLPG